MILSFSNSISTGKSIIITEGLNKLLEWISKIKSNPSFLIQIKPHYSLSVLPEVNLGWGVRGGGGGRKKKEKKKKEEKKHWAKES